MVMVIQLDHLSVCRFCLCNLSIDFCHSEGNNALGCLQASGSEGRIGHGGTEGDECRESVDAAWIARWFAC